MSNKKNNPTKDQLIGDNLKHSSRVYVDWARRLLQIGISLSHEKNIFKLLEMILYEARKFTNCDAGTFYRLSKNKKFLNFTVMHNDTMKEYSGGTSGVAPSLPAVPLFDKKGKPNLGNVCSHVFHNGESINNPDAYIDKSPLSEGPKKY